jgi:hypothetical protein
MRVGGGRREGAWERAVVHSAAATTPVLAAAVAVAPAHHTPDQNPGTGGSARAVDTALVS